MIAQFGRAHAEKREDAGSNPAHLIAEEAVMKYKFEIEVDLSPVWPKDVLDLTNDEMGFIACQEIVNAILRPAKANANVRRRLISGEEREVYDNRINLIEQAMSTISAKPKPKPQFYDL